MVETKEVPSLTLIQLADLSASYSAMSTAFTSFKETALCVTDMTLSISSISEVKIFNSFLPMPNKTPSPFSLEGMPESWEG